MKVRFSNRLLLTTGAYPSNLFLFFRPPGNIQGIERQVESREAVSDVRKRHGAGRCERNSSVRYRQRSQAVFASGNAIRITSP